MADRRPILLPGNRRGSLVALAGLLMAGCMLPNVGITGKGEDPKASASKKPGKSPSPGLSPSVSPSTSTAPDLSAYFGQVLGVDGKPAADVSVRGYIIASNGASYGVRQVGGDTALADTTVIEAKTDAEGKFELKSPDGKPLNVEAVLDPTTKAIKLDVPATARGLTLQLAPTGSISGQVTAPNAATVTNFEGVDVFIPGTSYTAKTDATGRYTLANVPVGAFSLVASKVGLGRANVHDVKVASKTATTAPELKLAIAAPSITKVEPANAGPGATVTLTGVNLGASTGAPLEVSFNGPAAINPERVNDTTIKAQVPVGATSGNIVVKVGSITSNGQLFTVLKSVALKTLATKLLVGAERDYEVEVRDTSGSPVATPSLTWSAEGAAFKVANGKVTGQAPGVGTLKVASGTLQATAELEIAARWAQVTTFSGTVAGLVEGPVASARFNEPIGVTVAKDGTLFVADNANQRVRKITAAGVVSTLAGSSGGFLDGPGAEAMFANPNGMAVDGDGNVYVTEYTGCRIRKITPTGTTSTVAGSGTAGYANGQGTQAMFFNPKGIAIDGAGVLYVADIGNHRIRKVTGTGAVTTFAGSGVPGFSEGTLLSSQFKNPSGVAMDGQGNFYVADTENHTIRKISAAGAVTNMAGNGTPGYTEGVGAAARFKTPNGVAVDAAGNVYVADTGNHAIRKITAAGTVTTLAGTGTVGDKDGVEYEATFNEPHGVAVDKDGNVYVADRWNHRIRKISP